MRPVLERGDFWRMTNSYYSRVVYQLARDEEDDFLSAISTLISYGDFLGEHMRCSNLKITYAAVRVIALSRELKDWWKTGWNSNGDKERAKDLAIDFGPHLESLCLAD